MIKNYWNFAEGILIGLLAVALTAALALSVGLLLQGMLVGAVAAVFPVMGLMYLRDWLRS
jgi:hypothetical protein